MDSPEASIAKSVSVPLRSRGLLQMLTKLSLQHEILLLALKDDKGTFSSGMFLYAVGGAMVSELLLQDRIVANDDKKEIVAVVDTTTTADPILDELLGTITDSKKNYGLQHWVSKAANMPNLKHRIAEQLCDLGVLQQDEQKVLWLFTRKVYPEHDGAYEDAIRARMAKVMFNAAVEPDAQTAILIALANHAGLLPPNFAPEELRQHKDRIKQLSDGKILASGATQATIQAVQAAVMVAAIMPAMTAATMAR